MKLNFFLLLIVAGLLFIAIEKPGLEDSLASKKITTISAKEIQTIEIISIDKTKVSFFKKNNQWFVKHKQKEHMVNMDKLNPLLQIPETTSLKSFSASVEQLKQYHLLRPPISIRFDKTTIAFGNSEPINHRRYVSINNQVHLIADLYYHLLLQPVNSYIKITQQ